MIAPEMVERVARAIRRSLEASLRGAEPGGDGCLPRDWADWHMEHAARAAIAAMGPTTSAVPTSSPDPFRPMPEMW